MDTPKWASAPAVAESVLAWLPQALSASMNAMPKPAVRWTMLWVTPPPRVRIESW